MRLLLRTILTLWLSISIMFFLIRILPGDAITAQLIAAGGEQALIDAQKAALGLDQPALNQYIVFLRQILRGDLGESYLSGQSVVELIGGVLDNTVILAIGALTLAIVGGISMGIASALSKSRTVQFVTNILITLALSLPIYWTGLLAIVIFSLVLNWLPASGDANLSQLILPVGVLAFHTAGSIALITRTQISDAAHADFVRTARAKGLPEQTVVWRHILRVGLLPIVNVIALQAGFLLSGTVITETLFLRSGLGTLLVDAVTRRDFPVVQGVTLVSAAAFVIVNMLSDGLTHLLDPRIRFVNKDAT